MMENRACLKADRSLQLFCPLEVPVGHERQLYPLPTIRECPRQGETSLRLRAIVCTHRHEFSPCTRSLLRRDLTMRERHARYEI
jgi:hypothetical protein